MAKIGYARVSTKDQSLNSQIDKLKEHGCVKIFSEHRSGRLSHRKELEKCLEYLREDDTLVLTKLDRLGRTASQLIQLSQELDERGIALEIIDLGVKTNTPMGKMFYTIMAGLAEMEVNHIRERTRVGLESARARGRLGGRKPMSQDKKDYIKHLYESRKYTVQEVANKTNTSRSTVHRIIREFKQDKK